MTAASSALPPGDGRPVAATFPWSAASRGDGRVLLVAGTVAALVHVGVLLLVHLPEKTPPPPPPVVDPGPRIRFVTPKPPELTPPTPVDRPHVDRLLPVPMPVPPSAEPTPVREPSPPEPPAVRDAGGVLIPDTFGPPPDPGPVSADAPGVVRPVLIPETKVEPVYPEMARRAGMPGQVVLTAVIARDGSLGEVAVLRASPAHLGFEQAAIDAVSQWRWVPGSVAGRPMDVVITIVVDFTVR